MSEQEKEPTVNEAMRSLMKAVKKFNEPAADDPPREAVAEPIDCPLLYEMVQTLQQMLIDHCPIV